MMIESTKELMRERKSQSGKRTKVTERRTGHLQLRLMKASPLLQGTFKKKLAQ